QNGYQLLLGLFKDWASDEDKAAYLKSWNRGLTGGLNYYRASHLSSPGGGGKPGQTGMFAGGVIIPMPTLVIWGEKDTALLTGNLDGLDKYVKQLRVVRVPDAGHWVVHEKPALVIDAMRNFLHRV